MLFKNVATSWCQKKQKKRKRKGRGFGLSLALQVISTGKYTLTCFKSNSKFLSSRVTLLLRMFLLLVCFGCKFNQTFFKISKKQRCKETVFGFLSTIYDHRVVKGPNPFRRITSLPIPVFFICLLVLKLYGRPYSIILL